jgi:diguanylate cyclase (GGDEF)-like protein
VPIGEHSLFGKDLPVSGLTAARVFPLFAAGEPVGTWIVTTKKGQFAPNVEVMLHALSQQVATSLMNAKLNEAMERMATTDALTGLYNRRFFNQVFAERLGLAERYGRKLSVLLCDIDHFKSVNDTYGHPAGDAVLKVISRLLAQEARKADVVGRLGGEEFAVLMSETDAAGAKLTAERMRERIARELILTEHGKLKVTLSLGIATFPDDAGSADLLISRADEALYRAKHGGRNRSVAYGVK